MATLSKFVRPDQPTSGLISDLDLGIMEVILRFRFPASHIWRLVGGNEDVTQRRLRGLWEHRLINREMLEEIRNNREKDYANAALKGQEMQRLASSVTAS